jgi:4-amino-4-deoxy-L-arabinose transferase-like glycosyltransferase
MSTIDLPRTAERPARPAPPAPPAPGRWRPTAPQLITAAIGLLAAVLYTWGLGRNGMANSYYAAAVRAGSRSWKAFFFGSIDPGSFITVDKPPAALWVMDLSARLFGFSSWSMLLPNAAAGVGSVLILHRLVRRWAGNVAAHLAALSLALTPVAVLMFRFNNPDAILTFWCLSAALALWTALETGHLRWLLGAAALIGLAFDTKMLQAFLVLPALALVYLWAGPPRLGRRILHLLAAGGVLLVSAGWWVAIVALWPAASRPYIGSTTDNSIISLVFGYNGFARLLGTSAPGGGGGPGGGPGGGGGGSTAFGGTPGVWRLFNAALGGDVAWLLPLAAAGLLVGLWLTRRAPRTDRGRAGWLLWGGWTLVCAAVFSLSKGIFHPYYSVQLAPGVAALAGAGAVAMGHAGRRMVAFRWVLPAVVLTTAGVAVGLLDRTPTFDPWLRATVTIGSVAGAAALFAAMQLRHRVLLAAGATVAALALLAGPAAYALSTVGHQASGSIPVAGPATGGGFGGGAGGGSSSTDSALISYLEAHRDGAEYLVAGFTSNATDSIIIASGQPVITIGGFNGSDPTPTLAQFERLVAEGKVRYVVVSSGGGGSGGGGPGGGGFGGGPGGGSGATRITQWVTEHGTQVPYGGSGSGTLYDVSGAA